MKSFTFKIAGPAGFGIMTTGLMFSKTASRSGLHIFDYVEYPSLIRGGHNVMETHFSKEEVFSLEKGIDVLVALNKDTVEFHAENIKQGGAIIFDPDQFDLSKDEFVEKNISLVPVKLMAITKEIGAPKLMENNVALGAAISLFNLPLENLYSVIEDTFRKKGEEVVNENKKAAEKGYRAVSSQEYRLSTLKDSETVANKFGIVRDSAVITGNEAVGLGAIAGGCNFYIAYPMTPASSVLHFMAKHAKKQGYIVRHAEDEIGVINEAIGASFMGARAMIGTSGGGFALMNETLSFAGISETPLVVFVAQRAGPATGMPTWTEQGDLLYIIRAGHGEFPKIVLTPGDVEEVFVLSKKAQNLASLYQTPVIVLTDKLLAESHKSIHISKFECQNSKSEINKGKIEQVSIQGSGKVVGYPRYKITEDGISPRILPGTKGYYYQSNSYEHGEDGHTSENSANRIAQVNKRAQKMKTYLAKDYEPPRIFGPENAEISLVGWGSTKGPVFEALKTLGEKANYIHFTHMWPMDRKSVTSILRKGKQLFLVENNSTGQLGQLLRLMTGVTIEKKLLKYNGRPIYPNEIVDMVK